jgi:NAD(P)-dependent dehydrogenase (short-subunit alcohol dehydrogenase family)
VSSDPAQRRPAALVTGAGKQVGIAAGIAARLADDGWDLALSYSRRYDAGRPDPGTAEEPEAIATFTAMCRSKAPTVVSRIPESIDMACDSTSWWPSCCPTKAPGPAARS